MRTLLKKQVFGTFVLKAVLAFIAGSLVFGQSADGVSTLKAGRFENQ